ncbi:MAG TPA: Fic family protein [Solirubrobacterales bacterium]|nr:Fic family protein [Solirubrobacterales bacterium]
MHVTPAPPVAHLMKTMGTEGVMAALAAAEDGRTRAEYLHWDKLQHLEPPVGLSPELWWLKVKLARNDQLRRLPLRDRNGLPLGYTLPDTVLRSLHQIDQHGGTALAGGVAVSDRDSGRRFVVNSLMEEAIRSSQLEGATTSREVAKELLRSGREPLNRSEQMVANNYRALQFMRDGIGDTLTPEAVLELHRTLTLETLDEPGAAGRLQRPGEERVRVYDPAGKVLYFPPPADQLPERLDLLCQFANADDDTDPFVHPVLRSILLHFWLAYDHPFLDGNGRTARILFFWAMRKHGYWFAECLPISRLIRKAPGQYSRAFLETETDEGDTTYFILHQLQVIEQAIADFDIYVENEVAEQRDLKRMLHGIDGVNGRQLVLLNHALKHPDHRYTFAGHAHSNRVTHETARADLGGLAERGLLIRRRRGRTYEFEPAPDLPQRLKESAP